MFGRRFFFTLFRPTASQEGRSPKWPALRKKFLQGELCAACGGTKKLEAHHIIPFHIAPDKELDIGNLAALCEGNKDLNCHLVIGHDFDFKGWNPDVVTDASRILQEKKANEGRIKQ